mgnify:CR=1 FL=1
MFEVIIGIGMQNYAQIISALFVYMSVFTFLYIFSIIKNIR